MFSEPPALATTRGVGDDVISQQSVVHGVAKFAGVGHVSDWVHLPSDVSVDDWKEGRDGM